MMYVSLEAVMKLRHYRGEISSYIPHVMSKDLYYSLLCSVFIMGHHLYGSRSADSIVEKEFPLDSEADPADWLLTIVNHRAYSFCASRQSGSFLLIYRII